MTDLDARAAAFVKEHGSFALVFDASESYGGPEPCPLPWSVMLDGDDSRGWGGHTAVEALDFAASELPGAAAGSRVAEVERHRASFEFESTGPAWKGIPVVNGHKLTSVISADVHLDAESFPEVTLKLSAADLLKFGLGSASVKMGEGTREALVSLGWTPPAGVSGRQRVALDLKWIENGQERRELFGPWTQGDPETEEGAVAHMLAAHQFLGEWRRLTGRDPAEVVATLLTDPDEWVRKRSEDVPPLPPGTEPVTP